MNLILKSDAGCSWIYSNYKSSLLACHMSDQTKRVPTLANAARERFVESYKKDLRPPNCLILIRLNANKANRKGAQRYRERIGV
jgi:hypothetical protein